MTAGDAATLESTVSGSPDLKVKWFKDGKEMISGRKYRMTLKENVASMKILTAERGDTSEYRMEVSNKVGKDHCTCSVTVLGELLLPVPPLLHRLHLDSVAGDDGKLSETVLFLLTEALLLLRAKAAEAVLMHEMFLLQQPDRIMPPTFIKSLKRVDGNIGNDVTMDCKVSGSQPMTITWFKDDQEIKTGSKRQPELKDSSATLHIAGLEKVDSGVYKCRATNAAGSKETSGSLYVRG